MTYAEPRRLATPLPAPTPYLATILDELRLAAAMPPQTEAEYRRVAQLPRPWDPVTCAPELRRLVYAWLDQVVGWLNEQHSWHPERTIPGCWLQHPHIVHQLATIAFQRWEVGYAVTPTAMEEWHRYALPAFLDRLARQMGGPGCPPGKHQPAPGSVRTERYRSSTESEERRRIRSRDYEAP